MGSYIYKVTNKIVTDENGLKSNLAVYAYKPSYDFFDGEKLNRRWAWQAKCHLADKYVASSKNYTGRVVMTDGGPSLALTRGTFTDDWFYEAVSKMKAA
jgi:hypothetical protein